ncbi:amidoligase family protein [Chakrabartyella piscis]|uniref:amidoligase family protein n=1 Tax=Chakrabartyella piscis TaxID=2918914 RepID=UPI0029588107|nr:amidoligase family protein [Chakrabartyella piscis]
MDLREQNFGIEIEMTGITRRDAAQIIADYFGTESNYEGSYYETYTAKDTEGRKWKLTYDGSINCQKKENGRKVSADRSYSTELVSPILQYSDIETVQEIVRKLREHGAFPNASCGIHIHVNAAPFDAKKLRNLVNIIAAKEDMVYKALQVASSRERNYCRKVDERFLKELNQKKPKTMAELSRIWYNGADGSHEHYHSSRYRCLNLHSVFQKGTIEFRAFNSVESSKKATFHAGKIKAYIQFCLAMTAQAHKQTSASPIPTRSTNEKYTFRVWLLRMGMIGDEFKSARGHLLGHLEGNIAWKDPIQAERQKERLRAKREQEVTEPSTMEVEIEPEDTQLEQEETPAFSMSMGM